MSHDWIVKFVEHRVGGPRIIRLIQKWLKAGVSEDGQWSETAVGTPQGAVVSPLPHSRTASWVNSKPRSRNISARSRRLSLYRSRQSTISKTMSVGNWRKLKGVPVRSLNLRPQPPHRNTAYPRSVVRFRLRVLDDWQ